MPILDEVGVMTRSCLVSVWLVYARVSGCQNPWPRLHDGTPTPLTHDCVYYDETARNRRMQPHAPRAGNWNRHNKSTGGNDATDSMRTNQLTDRERAAIL